jgi:hypothetical protein
VAFLSKQYIRTADRDRPASYSYEERT